MSEEVGIWGMEGGSCNRNVCCFGCSFCRVGREGGFWLVAGEEVADPGTGFRLTGSLEGTADFNRLDEAIEATEVVVEVEGTWSFWKGRPRSILLGSFLRAFGGAHCRPVRCGNE